MGADEPGAAHYHHYGSFVSPAISAGTFTGTLTFAGAFTEEDAGVNAFPTLYVYLWHSDDTIGTIIYSGTSATEATTAYPAAVVTYFNAVAITSFTAVATDRIVLEVETYDNNTDTDEYYQGFRFAGLAASGYDSYISFDLTAVSTAPLTQGASFGSANMMWI